MPTIAELEAEARRLERAAVDAEADMVLRPDPNGTLFWAFIRARDASRAASKAWADAKQNGSWDHEERKCTSG